VLLLATLQAGPAHGYAIIERLRLRSEGTFDLPEGTIYPALHRLEQAGLLTSRWSDESARRRRVYALTARGQAALEQGTQQWRVFALGVNAILFGKESPWQV
jgi:DNA-binding PadR family transcriptional regulator